MIDIERENQKRVRKKATRKAGEEIALHRAATVEVGAVVLPDRVRAVKGTKGIYAEMQIEKERQRKEKIIG